MLATVALGWASDLLRPAWACVVYLTIVNRRSLSLDGQQLNFGFEVLTIQRLESPTVLVHRLDDILVACRRQAAIVAGHDLSPDLDRLVRFATERRLPGIATLNQQWTDRTIKGRGMATMLDTAYDCDRPQESCQTGAVVAPDGMAAAVIVRQAISRTLAIALIAARASGRYDWTAPPDLDQLVTDAAWDQLDQLAHDPPEVTAP